ncbi:hypothetical protein DRN67_04155, partial [Candidatus Micrarchaeota archaeon]
MTSGRRVLGFFEKDAERWHCKFKFGHLFFNIRDDKKENPEKYEIDVNKLVPVRLASESVGLDWLDRTAQKLYERLLKRNPASWTRQAYKIALRDLVSAARKEA